MLAAGVGIPVPTAMNAALARYLDAPTLAGVIMLAVYFLTLLTVAAITRPGAIVKRASALRHLLFAGILVPFNVLSMTSIAPKFGVGNAIFFILIGQLLSAATIDHFGLLGTQTVALSWLRTVGYY